ncbi:uncharacterized protein LOC127245335 [Andrographis paniculata]|uniref:uncharacterized protein LOC127245335 n=1 Tax=Andrographis paniculata TaxID=175694 RepID=UPI0021E85912|nr:uncharacterized protein LOC127245335 [Andrographis paniculata]
MDLIQLQPPLHLQSTLQPSLFADNCQYDDDEDDVFYLELRKQVLQLTEELDDEDDGGFIESISETSMKAQKQVPEPDGSRGFYGWSWPSHTQKGAPPPWTSNLWRIGNANGNGNGTGVFIPQTAKPRRRCRSSRRKKNGRERQLCKQF